MRKLYYIVGRKEAIRLARNHYPDRAILSGEELKEPCENELEQGAFHHSMTYYRKIRTFNYQYSGIEISKEVWRYQIANVGKKHGDEQDEQDKLV